MNTTFAERLVDWQRHHGRHDLPWQQTQDPYRVWLSEIMLQQTQVMTVIPYYQRFLQRFPDIQTLAAAADDEVLAMWSGLGYYSRARNLHKAAKVVVAQHGGRFPTTPEQIAELPGIGRSTAAAIAAFCFGVRAAILDGNVKRVLARHAGITGYPGERAVEQRLWAIAEQRLPVAADIAAYTQGMMDLGASLCSRSKPLCLHCPLAADCVARLTGQVDALPTRKARKAIPERSATLLLIHHQGRLLFEKRPPTGIWGGLWTLPQIDDDQTDPIDYCRLQLGLNVSVAEALPTFSHTFTHFRLHLTPLPVNLLETPLSMMEAGRAWFDQATAEPLGLPSPIRKLISQLTNFQ